MIWRVYFSILQIDRSHMLWQLATETDAPIRAVAKHGPKKGTFRYTTSISFARTSVQRKIVILLHIIDMTTLQTPHLLTSQEFSSHLKTQKGVKSTWAWSLFLEVMNLLCSKGCSTFLKAATSAEAFKKCKSLSATPQSCKLHHFQDVYILYINPVYTTTSFEAISTSTSTSSYAFLMDFGSISIDGPHLGLHMYTWQPCACFAHGCPVVAVRPMHLIGASI